MIVVTVARRPLSEANVASNVQGHGTGAVNIDGCRIQSDNMPNPTKAPGWDAYNKTNAEQGYRPTDYARGDALYTPSIKGRWPANLILGHLDGCSVTGSQRVKSRKGGVRNTALGIMNDDSWKPSMTADRRDYLDADGMETVSAWECEPGCPVAELDEQSGDRPGMSGGGDQGDNKKTGYEAVPSFNRKPSAPFIRGDRGGASRFFKQVGGEKPR